MNKLNKLIVGMSLVALVVTVAACAGTQLQSTPNEAPGEALFNGRVKEDVNCYKCHNGDGTGTMRGPNLAKRVPKLTDQEISSAIEEGPSMMPSFKGKVTDQEIAELTSWLRTRFPKN
jgi:mono/diheme cytochrome c family protein